MKKGRHRRFEEARALKRTNDNLDAILDAKDAEPCPECGADPGHDHSSWCMYDNDADESAWNNETPPDPSVGWEPTERI